MVVGAAREIVREAEHVGDFFREVVGVFVAVAVAEIFHKASGGIAHMERHGIGLGFVDVVEDFAVGGVDGVGFGCERKVDGGFGEGEVAFGRTEEIEGVFGRERHGQGVGVGKPDVFAGHAHHAAREVERIFAGFDHAREPIEGGVRIGVAHGFVERGDEIEMLFPGFVVAEEFALENVFEEFAGDDPSGAFLGLSALGGELQCVVGGASVAVCEGGDAKKNVVRHFGRFVAAAWHGQQAARFVGEGAAKQLDDLRSGERFEDVHLGAGQKRRDDFKAPMKVIWPAST